MAKKHRPWIPLWIEDYTADTGELDAAEHGVYLLMLFLAWRQPDGTLPDDPTPIYRWLCNCIAGASPKSLSKVVHRIRSSFFTRQINENGAVRWANKRLSSELAHLENVGSKRKSSADQRWARARKNNELGDANGNANAMLPTPTQERKKERTGDVLRTPLADGQGSAVQQAMDPAMVEFYRRCKEVFIANWEPWARTALRAKNGDLQRARRLVEAAAKTEDPREFVKAAESDRRIKAGLPDVGA